MANLTFGSSVGQLIGGQPKTKPIYFSKEIANEIPSFLDVLRGLRTSDVQDLGDYSAAIRKLQPGAEAQSTEDVGVLSGLINRNLNYDPLAGYERLRTGNLSALFGPGGVAPSLAQYGSAADKINLAARGYGGRGPGSFERILTQDRISKNIAPVVNTIFGNLGRDASLGQSDRLNNLISTLNLIRQRAETPYAAAERILAPTRARSTVAGANLSNLGGLGDIARTNVAGFKQVKSPWQIAGEAGDSVVNAALDLYMSYLGGGFGGMGSGQSSQQPDMSQLIQMVNQYRQPRTYNYNTPSDQNYNFNIPGANSGYPGFN